MFDLEKSINQWLKQFRKHRAFNTASLREMELHLRDHIDDLIADGHSKQSAFQEAVAEFGEVPTIAEEEFLNHRRKTTLKSILFNAMLKSYSKTSFRGLMKNPLTSFINVFGLSLAIGFCLLVYVFIEFDYDIDQFHLNKDKIYLTTFFVDRDGEERQYGTAPAPLAQHLKNDFAQVKRTCRVEDRRVVIKFKENVFHEQLRYVDPDFLAMFTFPLQHGTASSLKDVNNIILSSDMAVKYFGSENALGKDMQVIFGESKSKVFKVSGVAQPFPEERTIDFDFLINFENLNTSDLEFDANDWRVFLSATFIQVDEKVDLGTIRSGMDNYRSLQNEGQNDWAITSFGLEPLSTLHFATANIRDDISFDYNAEARLGLPIIGLIMLALACFNYINIAIVSATKRLKEIGVRKVIGANKRAVVVQFLIENLVLTFFALLVGLFLAITVIIPWFRALSGDPIALDLLNINLWLFMIATTLLTAIISGIYPAFYISRFDTVNIFKGSVQFGKKHSLTKVFLGAQLIFTCMGIACALLFIQNNAYQNGQSWGYSQHELLYLYLPDSGKFGQLESALLDNQNILDIAGGKEHLGIVHRTSVLRTPERNFEADHLAVSPNYLETMQIEMVVGRGFKDQSQSDKQAIVVNERFIEKLSLSDPLEAQFEMDSIKYEVIGVVKDFHSYSFYHELRPTIFTVAEEKDYNYFLVRAQEGKQKEMYQELSRQWTDLFPEIPFQGGYQEDTWALFYAQLDKAEHFYKVLASVAIILASLGLYGLVNLNVAGRTKEFSIRKVLGAGIASLSKSVINEYALLVIVSLLVGIPLSHYMGVAALDMLYAYHMPVTLVPLITSVFILLAILLAVVSTQIGKVIKSNPVDGLRLEK
ncbi:MAG: ABC transporter permease [Bacteroidota bacterium]